MSEGAPLSCPVGGSRALTAGEVALARSMFGSAIDYSRVSIWRRKFFPFQPRQITMAPRGNLHFHPQGDSYCEDFAHAKSPLQALFIHEMTHVWQVQTRGNWFLILRRMPWARYDYVLKPGWKLTQYGIEQQAMIVQHAFTLRRGGTVRGAPPLEQYLLLLPFIPA